MEEADSMENVEYSQPIVIERRLWNMNNVLIAFVIGVILIIATIFIIGYFDLTRSNGISFGVIIIVLYAVTLFFLLEPKILREIQQREIRTISTPIIKEIEQPGVHTVEKPVERTVYVEKPIYKDRFIEKPRRKLKIPKYEFIGSTETKTYHKRSCRLGKLIKRKFKESNNSESFFKRKGYKPCKGCLKPKKSLNKK